MFVCLRCSVHSSLEWKFWIQKSLNLFYVFVCGCPSAKRLWTDEICYEQEIQTFRISSNKKKTKKHCSICDYVPLLAGQCKQTWKAIQPESKVDRNNNHQTSAPNTPNQPPTNKQQARKNIGWKSETKRLCTQRNNETPFALQRSGRSAKGCVWGAVHCDMWNFYGSNCDI